MLVALRTRQQVLFLIRRDVAHEEVELLLGDIHCEDQGVRRVGVPHDLRECCLDWREVRHIDEEVYRCV